MNLAIPLTLLTLGEDLDSWPEFGWSSSPAVAGFLQQAVTNEALVSLMKPVSAEAVWSGDQSGVPVLTNQEFESFVPNFAPAIESMPPGPTWLTAVPLNGVQWLLFLDDDDLTSFHVSLLQVTVIATGLLNSAILQRATVAQAMTSSGPTVVQTAPAKTDPCAFAVSGTGTKRLASCVPVTCTGVCDKPQPYLYGSLRLFKCPCN